MPVKRVLIVRHGETDYNATRRYQGYLDIPLNTIGQEQAQKLGVYLKDGGWELDAIYSSDLKRAYGTAQEIATVLGMDVVNEVRLREINVGIFQGKTREEIQAQHPEEWAQWRTDDGFVAPNGESRLQLRARAYEAWQEVTEQDDASTIMLVAHGGTIRQLMEQLIPADDLPQLYFVNTSLTILERNADDTWSITAMGTTPHLDDD